MAHGFLFINSGKQNLQSSIFDSSSTTLCLSPFFFPSSTTSSSVFTLHQQWQAAMISFFFPSINSFLFKLQSSVFDSSLTALYLSPFFFIINDILFSLHSSSIASSSIFINNTLLFFPSSTAHWLPLQSSP